VLLAGGKEVGGERQLYCLFETCLVSQKGLEAGHKSLN
jgi:hypothetical protein